MTFHRNKSTCWTRILTLGGVCLAVSVWACSVPVFRYALEHWTADPFQAIVFHRGPLTAEQQAMVRDLGTDGLAGRMRANISARAVDLNQKPPSELLDQWHQTGGTTLPWLVVRPPAGARSQSIVWSGPLAEPAVTQLLDSPARREIVRRLTEGESAVWVLIESGDPQKDAAAVASIETRLGYLMSTLQLPKLDAQDIANGLVSVGQDGLRLEFSTLKLARSDPQEQAFVQMLLGTETDLKNLTEPIVLPVFGRGRALYALVGAGIKRETIDQAATFLIGKCSCQIKDQNPGADLLLAADWTALIRAQTNAVPDLPSLAELARLAPVTVTISGSNDAGAPAPVLARESREPAWSDLFLLANAYLTGVLVVAGLVLAGLFWWRRKRLAP